MSMEASPIQDWLFCAVPHGPARIIQWFCMDFGRLLMVLGGF